MYPVVQTEVSHPRASATVVPNAAECCNSIDRPRKWIPNGERHYERHSRTISLVMETACRGNRRKEDTFTKGQTGWTEVEKGKEKETEGFRMKEKEGEEERNKEGKQIFLCILFSTL